MSKSIRVPAFASPGSNGFVAADVPEALRQPWTIIVGQRGDAVVWSSLNKNYWGDGVDLVWEILRGMR